MTALPDHDRFLALIEEHKNILHKVAYSYCRNPEDRADLTQEMIIQLWRSFGRFDGRCLFSTWMYRIALNVAISFYRSETPRQRKTGPLEESTLEIAAPVESPEESSGEIRELYRFINSQLDELNRALVILYLDDNSHDTIAEVLGISTSNVGTRIGRIKQQLRLHFGCA